MVKISNYILNTKFTAPKQDPVVYSGSLNVGQTTINAGSIGQQLASVNITVPSGTQSDIALIYFSTDNRYYTTHSLIKWFDNVNAQLYLNLYRISQTNYVFQAYASNPDSSAYTIPAFSATAWVRLLTSPF